MLIKLTKNFWVDPSEIRAINTQAFGNHTFNLYVAIKGEKDTRLVQTFDTQEELDEATELLASGINSATAGKSEEIKAT
jgi:hypothetical protein